jgi:acetyl-CoA C-acetyltransferase
MSDVAIVGIGIHTFGRHKGVRALEMGAIAARRALTDAGSEVYPFGFAPATDG